MPAFHTILPLRGPSTDDGTQHDHACHLTKTLISDTMHPVIVENQQYTPQL